MGSMENIEIKFKYFFEQDGKIRSKTYNLDELAGGCMLDNFHALTWNVTGRFQYIGLKDKNNVGIYCGDILKDNKNRLFQVIEDTRIGRTGYIMKCIKNKSENDHIKIGNEYDFWSWLYPINYLEIVGNIVENNLDEICC